MKLIVGVGNPGPRYRDTRHNVGFVVVEELARRRGLAFTSAPANALIARTPASADGLIIAKPMTYMNRSGEAAAALQHYYRVPLEEMLVVTEDVHLPLGRLRARAQGASGGHKGLRSIIEAFGTEAFPRLRVGVGRGDERRELGDYVLSRFDPEEREAIQAAVVCATDAVELFIVEGIDTIMNRYNQRHDAAGADASDADDGTPD